jgi:hypothetical protein
MVLNSVCGIGGGNHLEFGARIWRVDAVEAEYCYGVSGCASATETVDTESGNALPTPPSH